MPASTQQTQANSKRPPRLRIHNKLSIKFAVLCILILSCALGLRAYFSYQEQAEVLNTHLNEKAKLLGDFIALVSPNSILSFDYEMLDAYTEELSKKQDIVYSSILDSKGNELSAFHNNLTDHNKAHESDAEQLHMQMKNLPNVLHFTFPILFDEEIIGALQVGLSQKRLQTTLENNTKHVIWQYGATILILSLLLVWIFERSALKAIRALGEGAKRIATGDYSEPVRIFSHDELGDLTQHFNQMSQVIQSSITEKDQAARTLEELNKTLENRVNERTAELKYRETYFRTIVNNMGEGIITLSDSGQVKSMNPAAEKMFGQPEIMILDQHCHILFPGLDEDITLSDSTYSNTAFFGNSTFRSEHPQYGRDYHGKEFPIDITVTKMQLEEGQRHVCLVRDITERKQAEKRLAEAQQDLLEAAHKSGMADIATGVLHNIGNILNSTVLGSQQITDLIRNSKLSVLFQANELIKAHKHDMANFIANDERGKHLPDFYITLSESLKEEHEMLLAEAEALTKKNNMMKEVIASQQELAKQGSALEKINLSKIIEDSLSTQETYLAEDKIKIIVESSDDLYAIGQTSKLLQVTTNLIKNAHEAIVHDGFETDEKKIYIVARPTDDNHVELSVTDSGSGIEANALSKIFEHGFTTKTDGHGFGLHSCANAMKEMNGTISASSLGIGKGATFTLRLPTKLPNEAKRHAK